MESTPNWKLVEQSEERKKRTRRALEKNRQARLREMMKETDLNPAPPTGKLMGPRY